MVELSAVLSLFRERQDRDRLDLYNERRKLSQRVRRKFGMVRHRGPPPTETEKKRRLRARPQGHCSVCGRLQTLRRAYGYELKEGWLVGWHRRDPNRPGGCPGVARAPAPESAP